MTLHGAAKAPNVLKSDDGSTEGQVTDSTGATANTDTVDASAATDNSGGTADGTIEAVSGSGADAAINNNFAELNAKVNEVRDDIATLAEKINNLIDHLNDR